MLIARAVLAAVIAVSVALVPATGGATISTKPVEMSMVDQMDMPCCPPPDDCKGSVACAFKCFSFVAITFQTPITLTHVVEVPPPSFAGGTLQGYIIPPTHPPPI